MRTYALTLAMVFLVSFVANGQITDTDRVAILQADLAAARAAIESKDAVIAVQQKVQAFLQSAEMTVALANQSAKAQVADAAVKAADAERSELAKKCPSGKLQDGKYECAAK